MEKEFRAFMHSRGLKLASLKLPDALDAMSEFWGTGNEFETLSVDGDALVAYEDVSDYGKGTRLELGFIRLLRLPLGAEEGHIGRAVRLRLRLCYKWDMDVIRDVLPHGTWSLACWAHKDVAAFKQVIREKAAFLAMFEKLPSEVRVTLEDAVYPLVEYRPGIESRQMWWGIRDVM